MWLGRPRGQLYAMMWHHFSLACIVAISLALIIYIDYKWKLIFSSTTIISYYDPIRWVLAVSLLTNGKIVTSLSNGNRVFCGEGEASKARNSWIDFFFLKKKKATANLIYYFSWPFQMYDCVCILIQALLVLILLGIAFKCLHWNRDAVVCWPFLLVLISSPSYI